MRREIPNGSGPPGRKIGYLLLLGPSHRFGVGAGPLSFQGADAARGHLLGTKRAAKALVAWIGCLGWI